MTTKQKDFLLIMALAWILIGLLVAEICNANEPPGDGRQKPDLGLWLARACVGEAGWKSFQTGECAAIAHIFHKRSYNHHRRSYFKSMVDYSAALRVGYKTRPWLKHLNRAGNRPRMLESNVSWSIHHPLWVKTLDFADRFFKGQIPDPTPKALHFGGVMDVVNMDPLVWKQIDTPFRNKFWERRM